MDDYKLNLLELFKQKALFYNSPYCIKNLLGNRKIILYGAGDGFITFSVFVLQKYGLKASAILDRKFKFNQTFCGIPAFSPFRYQPTKNEREEAIVVITVGKKQYHREIFNCLRKKGFKNIILASDIYEYHLLITPLELKVKKFNYYLDNKKKILDAFGLFSDDLSRHIYLRVIQTHLQRKPISIPYRSLKEQYFPKDIRLNKGYARYINCGAYNGDTLKQLNKLYGRIETVICFEPDSENFVLLTQYLSKKHNKIAKNIIAFPCGVFSKETVLSFNMGNRINSAISDKGNSSVQCVALDDVLFGFNPTFITMDIEGAELEALKGAEKLIKKNKPDLAISVYHSPNHIWDIPLYLKSLNLGYKFYLRNYTSFISETILYATT